jgi:hypothetical protein
MSQGTSRFGFCISIRIVSDASAPFLLISNILHSEIMSKHTVTGGADFLEVREDIDTHDTDFVCTLKTLTRSPNWNVIESVVRASRRISASRSPIQSLYNAILVLYQTREFSLPH